MRKLLIMGKILLRKTQTEKNQKRRNSNSFNKFWHGKTLVDLIQKFVLDWLENVVRKIRRFLFPGFKSCNMVAFIYDVKEANWLVTRRIFSLKMKRLRSQL